MNSPSRHGLFLVSETTIPVLDSQALANPSRNRDTYIPAAFFVPQRETPVVVLRRVLKSLYSFSFNA